MNDKGGLEWEGRHVKCLVIGIKVISVQDTLERRKKWALEAGKLFLRYDGADQIHAKGRDHWG